MNPVAKLCLRNALAASSAILALAFAVAAQSAKSIGEPQKYIGPGSCAATSCHGSVKPVADSRILQTEYTTWILQDKHSRAYQSLTGDVGERMARILKLDAKAEESPKCLACHALYAAPAQQGRRFEISEGVSCENCHGPALAWLGPHTTRDWQHEKSLAAGMVDTRNVIRRTEKCLECHLGSEKKFVDHEMIAAGHPDLYFELDSFSAVMPRHWKAPRESAPGKAAEDPNWVGVLTPTTQSETKKIGPNIPSCPALLVTIHWGLHKIAGGRRTATQAGAPAIRRGTLRATWCSAFWRSRLTWPRRKNSTSGSPLSQ